MSTHTLYWLIATMYVSDVRSPRIRSSKPTPISNLPAGLGIERSWSKMTSPSWPGNELLNGKLHSAVLPKRQQSLTSSLIVSSKLRPVQLRW